MLGRWGLVGPLLLGACSLLELPGDGVGGTVGGGGSAGGPASGGMGGDGAQGGSGGEAGAPNGTACSASEACASGHCVDGRCCESTCTESCRRCDLSPGVCAPVEVGSSCDASGRCDGAGVCTTGLLRGARMYGAEGRDRAPAIADDGNGGVVWVGLTDSDELDVGGDLPVNHLFIRNETAFASRADLDGETVAVTSFGGAGDLTDIQDAVTDSGKGLAVAALLDGELFAGAVTATGGRPVFVRLDPNLAYGWHVAVAVDTPLGALRVADRPGGGFVAAGGFAGDASLGESTVTASSEEGAFVVQVGPGGQSTALWAPTSSGSGITRVAGVDVDGAGRIWLGGHFTVATLELGPGQTASNGGGEDAFVAVLEPDLTLAWFHTWGGTGDQRVEDLAVDASGRAWVGGSFTEALPLTDRTLPATTAGAWDAFSLRLDPAGEEEHPRSLALSLSTPAGVRVGVDAQQNASVAFPLGASPVDLGLGEVVPGPGPSYLIAKIAPTGEALWSRTIASTDAAGSQGALVVTDVAGLADGGVAVAGHATTDIEVATTLVTADPTLPDDDELWFALFQP